MIYTPDLLIEKQLSDIQAQKLFILDYGCGEGRFVRRLLDSGFANVHGTDLLVHGNDREREQTAERLASQFNFYLMNESGQTPFEDNSVDVVVCNQVMEHVADKESLISEVWRILKRNGFAIFVFPVSDAIIEHHVKLPFFHRADLNKSYTRIFYKALVFIGFGAWHKHSERLDWLKEAFSTYSHGHHYIYRQQAISLLRKYFDVEILDGEYLKELKTKYPIVVGVLIYLGIGKFLLSQVGMAARVRKHIP